MVTLLITSVLVLGLIALAIYFWQKPSDSTPYPELPPPNARGLFETTAAPELLSSENNDTLISELRLRASLGDKTALQEATPLGSDLYNELLSTLVSQSNTDAKLLALISYITRHELSVNKAFAEAVMRSWRLTPDRASTAKMLHIAARSDDAGVYGDAIEMALHFWREGKIPDLSAIEFQALLTGEFWVLSTGTRSSGAGFMLKRTLSSARRELETATKLTIRPQG